MHDSMAVLGVAMATLALIVGVEILWRTVGRGRGLDHEIARKAHHIGIGLIASGLPLWLPSRFWGFVLALGFGVLLLTCYKLGVLTSLYHTGSPSPTARAVRKEHHAWIGPACFSLAVASICGLCWTDLPVYRAAILVLTFADSAASLVGMQIGTHCYEIFGTRRSLEGNAALFIFSGTILMFTLGEGGVAGGAGVAVALLTALLLCLIETISPIGLDNLTLPAMTAVVVRSLLDPTHAHFLLTRDTIVALCLVSVTALLFTLAHVSDRVLHAATLVLGASTVVLLDMGRDLYVGILFVFLACALLANHLAYRQGMGASRAGAWILMQVAPCTLLIVVGRLAASSGLAVGSLACLIVLAHRSWDALLGGEPAHRPEWFRKLVAGTILVIAGAGGAWAAILLGGTMGALFDLTQVVATLLTVGIASALGGLVSVLVVRRAAGPGVAAESLAVQVIPAALAIVSIPAVTNWLMGIWG